MSWTTSEMVSPPTEGNPFVSLNQANTKKILLHCFNLQLNLKVSSPWTTSSQTIRTQYLQGWPLELSQVALSHDGGIQHSAGRIQGIHRRVDAQPVRCWPKTNHWDEGHGYGFRGESIWSLNEVVSIWSFQPPPTITIQPFCGPPPQKSLCHHWPLNKTFLCQASLQSVGTTPWLHPDVRRWWQVLGPSSHRQAHRLPEPS